MKDVLHSIIYARARLNMTEQLNLFISKYEHSVLPLKQLLSLMTKINHSLNNDILISILAKYCPSSHGDNVKDSTLIYLLNQPKNVRQEDADVLSQCISFLTTMIKEKKIPFKHPFTNLVMTFCLMYSGLYDDYGIGLDIAFNDVERHIGHLPIEDLLIYDNDLTQVTAGYFAITRLCLVFFDLNCYKSLMHALTTKTNNRFNLRLLGRNHGQFLHLFQTFPLHLQYQQLSSFMTKNNIIKTRMPLKINVHIPDIPEYAAEYYAIDQTDIAA